MFAYCLNNPTNSYDPDGELTRRQIHDSVLSKIVELMAKAGRVLSMYETTIYYNGSTWLGGWGFCDLYDYKTGEVWELKRITCSQTKAENQLNGYIKGRLKIKKHQELQIGKFLFDGKHNFTVPDGSQKYHITFWQGENGILWYDYYVENGNSNSVSKIAKVLMFFIFLSGSGGGGSAGNSNINNSPIEEKIPWAA